MIAIIDYEGGNLTSVERAVRHLGADCVVTKDTEKIARAERVIFPGVGAAGSSMENLIRLGLDMAVRDAVDSKKPVLGICVGCQIIFDWSEENLTDCLGLIPGKVIRFKDDMPGEEGRRLKIPHMGWNRVNWINRHPVFSGLPQDAEFYFVHSYYPEPARPENLIGKCDYGLEFAAAVAKRNLVAVQFHPEKSGRFGLKIFQNFLTWDGKGGADA